MRRIILSAEERDAAEIYARLYGVTLSRAASDALVMSEVYPDLTFDELLYLAAEKRERDNDSEAEVDVVDDC